MASLAKGSMMAFQSTRRRFIAGSRLLPLTHAAAKADREPPSQPPNQEVSADRDELLKQQRQLDERWKIANAQLPDWCKPGHKYRDIEGKGFGDRVRWPPLSARIAIDGVGLLVRASPYASTGIDRIVKHKPAFMFCGSLESPYALQDR
jgi:hypothetical protein